MKPSHRLLLCGISHNSAKDEVCGCFGVDAARKATIEAALAGCAEACGFTVLSTCNRMELYVSVKSDDEGNFARNILINNLKFDSEAFELNGYVMRDRDAACHLMEVCAGLDSEMIGETEIMGQVKQAYADASARGFADALIHRVFQKSFSAAKHARETSGICIGQATLGSVAAERARRIYGDFSKETVLVVGSGRVGSDVANSLKIRGAKEIVITSRAIEHSESLAIEIGAKSAPFDEWPRIFANAGIAIFCTSSPDCVLTKEIAKTVMSQRRVSNLLIVDLSVPANVEPSVGDLPDVFLYTFDDLARAVNENLAQRKGEIEACKSDIAARASALWNDVAKRVEAASEGSLRHFSKLEG
jgi:glutamyl-tRNA reductase